jgi:hypothetical protein
MTHQDVPTSSTIHLMYVPTHQLLLSTMYPTSASTKIPHQFHRPNMICNFAIDLVYMIDLGGYRWPPTFSNWLKIAFWQFWQFTIFSSFNFRGHSEGLNEGFSG